MGSFIGGSTLSNEQKLFNRRMSLIRISIENCFGRIGRLWQWIDWRKRMIIRAQPVGQYWFVEVLFTNYMTCFRGNVVSSRFETTPSLIKEYLNSNNIYVNVISYNVWPNATGFTCHGLRPGCWTERINWVRYVQRGKLREKENSIPTLLDPDYISDREGHRAMDPPLSVTQSLWCYVLAPDWYAVVVNHTYNDGTNSPHMLRSVE